MRILAISGSLRAQSTNTSLLRSLVLLAPSELEIVIYEELGRLPAFNPDLERNHQFDAVTRFQQALQRSTAVIFSTPEYAHGIPGSLKNALDWVVGSGELSEKVVMLMNASSRAVYAQAALTEVLFAMNAKLAPTLNVTAELPRRDMSPQEIAG
jgi:chromate reductase